MDIYPAIDLINGKVVRLYRGDYARVTDYDRSCEDTARAFKAQGASHIHVVDLDGAKLGRAVNSAAVKGIINATDAFVEVGGGIRTEEQIDSYLNVGANRVILGTVAVKDFDFVGRMAKKYGEKIAVGVDALGGKVAVGGWREVTETDAEEFCRRLYSIGIDNVICTDIEKDGALGGTNIEFYKRLLLINGLKITASGGITTLDEIEQLKSLGIHAAILGKAIYENRLSLKRAVYIAEGA